jgi:hypothetical protein
MGTNLDTIQSAIVPEPLTEFGPESAQTNDNAIENHLTQEITTLWSNHTRLSGDRKTTAKELRLIRTRLAERLAAMKSLLSRPGRNGQWRSWLNERGIPRSSADRLCARHLETLDHRDGDAPGEAISNSSDNPAEKLAKSVWSRYGKVLTTHEIIVRFLAAIAEIAGLPHDWRQDGLMILHAPPIPSDAMDSFGSAIESTTTPSDEVVPMVVESALPAEVGESNAVADGGSAAVV